MKTKIFALIVLTVTCWGQNLGPNEQASPTSSQNAETVNSQSDSNTGRAPETVNVQADPTPETVSPAPTNAENNGVNEDELIDPTPVEDDLSEVDFGVTTAYFHLERLSNLLNAPEDEDYDYFAVDPPSFNRDNREIAAALFLLSLALPSEEQVATVPSSPCPSVFTYESTSSEPLRWYGKIHLTTDSTLYSVWLNIILDTKADILGNWIGEVTTKDNKDFKIENTVMTVQPGPATPLEFFVQYSPLGKVPKIKAIRLNGREICTAPSTKDPVRNKTPSQGTPSGRPDPSQEDSLDIKGPTVYSNDGAVVSPQSLGQNNSPQQSIDDVLRDILNKPEPASSGVTSSIGLTPAISQKTATPTSSTANPNTRRVPPTMSADYFDGLQPTFVVDSNVRKSSNNDDNQQENCGAVDVTVKPSVKNGDVTVPGQFPWQVALHETQEDTSKYVCGGTLVTLRYVITAAHCVTRKSVNLVVNRFTLIVHLGKHNLRTSVDGVQLRLVQDIIVHPEYNATSFRKDLAILVLQQRVQYTKWVRPACLWPEDTVDLSNIVGRKGSVVGWGFDASGIFNPSLKMEEMPVVSTETCIWSYREFFGRFTSEFTYCAGFKNRTYFCNGDSGGGMVFKNNDRWYLRGLVSLAVARRNEYRCDPSHYVVFTDLAKFLPWIKENTYDY